MYVSLWQISNETVLIGSLLKKCVDSFECRDSMAIFNDLMCYSKQFNVLLLHTAAVKVKLRAGVTLYAEPSDSGWLQINKYAVIKNALAQQCVDNKRSVMDVKRESFSFSFLFKRVMLLYTYAQRPVNNDTKPGVLSKRRNRFIYAIHVIGLQAFNISYFWGDDSKMMTRLNQIFLHLSASGNSRKIFRVKNIDSSSDRQNRSSISFITSRMLSGRQRAMSLLWVI